MLDPQHRLMLECAWSALEDAGANPLDTGLTTGVFASASSSDYLRRMVAGGQLDAADTGGRAARHRARLPGQPPVLPAEPERPRTGGADRLLVVAGGGTPRRAGTAQRRLRPGARGRRRDGLPTGGAPARARRHPLPHRPLPPVRRAAPTASSPVPGSPACVRGASPTPSTTARPARGHPGYRHQQRRLGEGRLLRAVRRKANRPSSALRCGPPTSTATPSDTWRATAPAPASATPSSGRPHPRPCARVVPAPARSPSARSRPTPATSTTPRAWPA